MFGNLNKSFLYPANRRIDFLAENAPSTEIIRRDLNTFKK